tara:strand:+ start:2810 stop:3286 length:477 start_codon:yes stop_codon:yes gene_type:complete
MKTSHFKYIGIDPGVGGGIALIDEEGKIKAYKCPGSSEDMALLFEVLIGDTPPDDIKLLMERVWARPANAVRAAFTYGVNYGQWLGIAASHEIKMNTIIPAKWIHAVGCPKALKSVIRKRWLKEKAKELYPDIKRVTLKTSDAILITHYAKGEYFNGL